MANFLDKTGLQEYDRLVKEHIENKFSQYVDLSSAQTITGNKITTGTFKVQNGDAKGSFVVGADVNAKTLTANTRKLGRMGVPAYTSNGSSVTSTVAGISFDAQAYANYADFGGHPNNTSSIAPDVIRFVVANQHNNTINGARTLALQISKQDGLVDTSGGGTSVASAKFFVPVQATSTVTASGGFVGDLTGKASDSDKLDGNDSAYFLNYDNFTNTPTIPSTASEVGADPSGSANTALTNAKSYTDTQIANLINGAPDTLNTLGEIATAMSENAGVVTALQSAIGDKANKTDIPTDYISTGSTAQCRTGGLVLGVSSIPSGVNATAGRVYVIGSNPLFGLKATADGSTQFFLQAQKDNLYLGPTSSNALQFNKSGAVTVPSTLTAQGLITANNGLKTSKIQAPTTSGGSTYGVGSSGQVLLSNGSTNYWGQFSYDNLSNKPTIPTVPTNVSSFENDAGYLTSISKSDIGLENVENKSSATIRSEITKSNVTTALGYTPPTQDTTYSEATTTTSGLMPATDKTKIGATNIAYGTCSTAAATAAKVVTISGNDNWELTTGSIIVVKFSATNSASNPTLNVNETGAKPVAYGTANITTGSLSYAGYANRYIEYMYDGASYVFIGWSYDANSTYSNASLGQGYGTCSTAETTLAKTVAMSGYTLTKWGITVVKFTNAVPANSTLNINSKGAKNIFWKGSAITDGVIKAGDTASFIYDGTQYQCFSIDRDEAGGSGGSGSIDTTNLQVKKLSILDPGDSVAGYFQYSDYGGVSASSDFFANVYIPTTNATDISGQTSPYSTVYARGGIVLNTDYSDTNSDGNTKLLFPTDRLDDQTFATREWVQAQGYGSGGGGGSVDTTNFKVNKLTLTYRDTDQGYIAPQTSYGGIEFSTKTFVPSLIPTTSINDSASQVSPYGTRLVQGGVILNTNYSSENMDGVTKLKYPTDRLDDQTFATREWVQAQGYGSGGGSGTVDTSNFKVDKLTLTYLDSEQGSITPNINYSGIEFSRKAFAPVFVPSSDISSTGGRAGYSTTQYLKGGILVDTAYSNANPDGTTKLKFPTDRVEDQTLATREWVLAILEEKGLI